jgi:iron complex transport system ATP-binding protein
MTALLEASAVTVRIAGRALLDGVSLALGAGETVALAGPNGAGKSTLLRTLSGELRPSAGSLALKGRPLASYGPRALAQHRAVLAQSIAIAFPFSVAEIVRMGAGDARGRRVEALIELALAELEIEHLRERAVTTLSGGEQQRAQLARVLVQLSCGEAAHGPGVLLLDEPTASLDLRHQLDVIEAAQRRAARGSAVLAVLHDLNLAARLASRVVVLDRGRIARDGPPPETITDAALAAVFGVADAVGRVPAAPFVLPHAAYSVARPPAV